MVNWRKQTKTVGVLGCGPAGLFAASAAADLGYAVRIFSRARQSEMFGAQYLHQPVPGLSEPNAFSLVEYRLEGSLAGYAEKVYGPTFDPANVSPASLTGQHPAWNIRAAYDRAWGRWGGKVEDTAITPAWLDTTAAYAAEAGVWRWIWSIPLQPFCEAGHTFSAREVWAKGDAPERNSYCPVSVPPWTVVCNGEKSPGWYRASNVFGYKTAEWPQEKKPPVSDVARVVKPIGNNCTCWATIGRAPVLRVGRYGRWVKGELSHQAYERVVAWLK